MSDRRLFGIETEYAVTGIDYKGNVLPAAALSGPLLHAAAATLSHVNGATDAGLFLGNGSRLYVDAGAHPELAGPECLHPSDIVRYARAGDAILLRLATAMKPYGESIADVRVFTGNVDYSGTRTTWGAHESYCHRADIALLRRRLVPHLVSRVIYCGAGGFNPLSQGLEFTLSPRSHHLAHVVSDESTHDRGIIHTRNEALCSHGYRRQHLICGESLRSDLGTWLKIGTTALVVALVEGGVDCGEDVALKAPVEALRSVAADVHCRQSVATKRGTSLTAVEIQRHYLECAKANLAARFMPDWAADVCRAWEEMLVRLVRAPDSVATSLDWAIKLTIYRNHAAKRGFNWTSLAAWSHAVNDVQRTHRDGLRTLLSRHRSSTTAARDALHSQLAPQNLRAEQLAPFLTLRDELLEADMRWGQLGPEGIFEALQRAGLLDHHVSSVAQVDEAVNDPPPAGRARVRGTAIREVSSLNPWFSAGWDHVRDNRTGRLLDLSDPFTEAADWSPPRSPRKNDPLPPDFLDEPNSQLERDLRILGRSPRQS